MKQIYLFLILCFLLTGCALSREQISLNYDPMLDVAKIDEAEKVPLQITVVDKRDVKNHVSRKKNGYGMEMAKIICQNDVNELIKQALIQELTNRGFDFNTIGSHFVPIEVELVKCYNNFNIGFWTASGRSETILNIKVRNSDGTWNFSKTIIGNGNNRNVMVMTGHNAKIALEESLKHAIAQLVEEPEFIKTLLKYKDSFPSVKTNVQVYLSDETKAEAHSLDEL